jgi:hypothetical protein
MIATGEDAFEWGTEAGTMRRIKADFQVVPAGQGGWAVSRTNEGRTEVVGADLFWSRDPRWVIGFPTLERAEREMRRMEES